MSDNDRMGACPAAAVRSRGAVDVAERADTGPARARVQLPPCRHRSSSPGEHHRYTASGAQTLRWVSASVDCGPAAAESHLEGDL